MASYRIEWKRSAVKDLKNLPKDVISRILGAVEQLARKPIPERRQEARWFGTYLPDSARFLPDRLHR